MIFLHCARETLPTRHLSTSSSFPSLTSLLLVSSLSNVMQKDMKCRDGSS